MRRFASAVTITAYLLSFIHPAVRFGTLSAQATDGQSAPNLSHVLGLDAAASGGRSGPSRPATAGFPSNLDSRAPLSAAVMTAVGGRGTQFSETSLFGDWDGREDLVADHSQKVRDLSGAESDPDFTLTRTAVSAHSFSNGFNENIYYYGDSVGNVYVSVDTAPSVSFSTTGSVDDTTLINLPTVLNAFGTLLSDDQVVVTGLCVNPVADLTSFANVNGSFAPFSGQVGEVLYVTYTDTGGGLRLTGSNIIVKSGVLAFPIADVVSPAAAPPGVQSAAGFPVTVGGSFGVAFSVFHNLAGCAVDDDGSAYFQQVDLTQQLGANIVKITDIGTNQDRSPATNGFLTITTLNPTNGLYGNASGPAAQVNRFTNYSGTSTTFGNITALAAGPGNTLFAALSASSDGTPGSGLFQNPSALGATPSMIISFADAIGTFTPAPSVLVPDGFADVAASGLSLQVGVNNFRAFALGLGPDRRAASGTDAAVFGTPANTLKLDFQVDYTIYSGLIVNEDRQVFVVSGGTPAGVGLNPSPATSEILGFADTVPADRRGDFVDYRGNVLPNPPASGGNVGDGDSDRFDHVYLQAPFDAVTFAPTGLAGLSRGFLRYTNRLAPNAIGAGITLGQTAGTVTQDNDQTDGPIFFGALDPGFQVGGGDDQNTPFRGDDSDGGGNPTIAGPLEGGFEFSFGAIVGGICTAPWNAFFLNSNGSVSFSAGSTDSTPDATEFLTGPPMIAGALGDLNPAARSTNTNQFPVQAIGFAGVNHFKVRWINVPRTGQEAVASRSSFSISMFDDGTGVDENASQPLNPANPIGNNAVPFDLQEGPTDLQFTQGPGGVVGNPARPSGSSQTRLEYGWMDTGANLNQFIAGYSTGAGTALAGSNLSSVGRGVLLGVGTEAAIFEQFSTNNWDLRFEGNDATASMPAGQPDPSLETVVFFGKTCAAVNVNLNVGVLPTGGGSVAGTGIACPGDCVEPFASGATPSFTATPADGFLFSSWTGCDSAVGNVCTMLMSGPRQLGAVFQSIGPPPAATHALDVSVNGTSFSTGQTLVVSATLDPSLTGPGPLDAYVVLTIPGGAQFSLQLPLVENLFVPGIHPASTNFFPFPFSGPIMASVLSGLPAGEYTIIAAVTQAGTFNVITTPSTVSFTFTP